MMKYLHSTFGRQGNYSPSTVSTSPLDEFLTFDIGMFIHYNIESFMATDIYVTNMLNDPPAPSLFAPSSTVNSAQWATEAANLGCKYAVLTASHQHGFNLFPFTGSYNGGNSELTYDSNRGTLTVPLYKKYDVSQTTANQDIIDNFKAQCIVEGIKFGLYYNTGKQINFRRGTDLIDGAYDQTNTFSLTYEHYIDFVCQELQYICQTYAPDYLWLDAPHFAPRYKGNDRNNEMWFQNIYNTIKTFSPNTLALINYDCAVISGKRKLLPNGTDLIRPPFTWDGDELMVFPSDILAFEAIRYPADSAEFNPFTNHMGVTYYMPKEIVDTIYASGQYFCRNNNFGSLKTLVELQEKYDVAKANGIPYMLNIAPNKDGVLRSVDLTRFGEIVL